MLPAVNAANVYLLVKNDVERFDGTSPSYILKKGRTFILILVKAQIKMDPFNFLFSTKVKMAPLVSYLIISAQNLSFIKVQMCQQEKEFSIPQMKN